MLFNSHEFVFAFLPVVAAVYFLLARRAPSLALPWLTLASLAFYAWWKPADLGLLLASLVGNFLVGRAISGAANPMAQRTWLTVGIVANLLVLMHYKYTTFVVQNLNAAGLTDWSVLGQELPLGISFFTFQQIAYLCDCARRRLPEHTALEYGLFVSFFPQLIAGPIVRPDDILPQFRRGASHGDERLHDLVLGVTLFLIGLFKKTVLADGLAGYASPVFAAAEAGQSLNLLEAWGGALAYTFQLYFDFSGYSDMALGAARLFGIRLPWNFDSPYQAHSISDFWRRWHLTLSACLREFIYIPLGGSRCASWRRSLNLFLTMLLGGLWHGAGWTFVLWGALHGAFLTIDHSWQSRFPRSESQGVSVWAKPLTFLAVVAAWVLFRAPSLSAAGVVYSGMLGRGGLEWQKSECFQGVTQVVVLLLIGLLVGRMPNSRAWYEQMENGLAAPGVQAVSRWAWRPSMAWGWGLGVLGAVAVLRMAAVSEFIYFQF